MKFLTSDQNDSLAPRFEIGWEFMEQKIKEFVLRYNYTLNPNGVYEAMKFMYTYWPDPNNKTHIRDQYVHVSRVNKHQHCFCLWHWSKPDHFISFISDVVRFPDQSTNR